MKTDDTSKTDLARRAVNCKGWEAFKRGFGDLGECGRP